MKNIELYEQKLRFAGRSKTTIRSYTHNVQSFLNSVEVENPTQEQVDAYLDNLLKNNIERSTWNQKMYSIRFYFENVLHKKLYNVDRLRVRQKRIKIPTKDKILNAIRQAEDLRDKVILLMFYDGMFRRSELQVLRIEDISMTTRCVYIRGGKGDKDRIVKISDVTRNFVEAYLSCREEKNNPYLLNAPGSNQKYICKHELYDVVHNAGLLVDEDYWHPHLLRHAGATHLLEKTGNIYKVSKKLGHSDIKTTVNVYTHLTSEETIEQECLLDKNNKGNSR